jgi:hypothetical protein
MVLFLLKKFMALFLGNSLVHMIQYFVMNQ